MEIWKDIPNYNGYQVSNLGRVRTHNKTTYTEKHGKRVWKDRILKYKSKSYTPGYRVDLWKDGKPKTFLVARLVAFTFYNQDINNKKLTVDPFRWQQIKQQFRQPRISEFRRKYKKRI